MSGLLHLYRFVEDAWRGGLEEWCRDSTRFKAQGIRSWLVLENAGQRRWLDTVPDELEIVDSTGLRCLLAEICDISAPASGTAAAELLVKIIASRHPGPEAAAARRNPSALLEAANDVLFAGGNFVDPAGREIANALRSAAMTPTALDLRLRDSLPTRLPVRICWFGWDASRWDEFVLIEAIGTRAVSRDFFLPLPRLPADALQRGWIEALERTFDLKQTVCESSGFASQNEPLVARLERSGGATPAPPGLLVGRDWTAQVRLVCEEVLLRLKPRPARPVGIVAPDASATAVAVAEALARQGVLVERPGRAAELPGSLLIIEQIARYHLQEHDVEELIELAKLLFIHCPKDWNALAPEAVFRTLDFAFASVQSRNSRVIANALAAGSDPVRAALLRLVKIIGRWDDESTWQDLRGRWDAALAALRLPQPNLKAPDDAPFQGERLPGRLFMEWVASSIAEMRRDRPQPEFASRAPVVVTTFSEAAQQTWSHLIFLDSNEGAWPGIFTENQFLSDPAKAKLNNRKDAPRVLTSRDRWALDQARFLDLLEHCQGGIAFAGTAGGAEPNEWVLRALMEAEESPLEAWNAAAARAPAFVEEKTPGELAQFAVVHASRSNPLMPPDRYSFDFHESQIKAQAWSATSLDKAAACPATFALSALFDAQPSATGGFARNEGQAVGSRAHRWLARVLGGNGDWQKIEPADYDRKLAREFAASRRELEGYYAAEGLALPLWWETCLQKSAWAARRCFRELAPLFEEKFCAIEQRLDVSVKTDPGPLLLKGRIDILLSDRAGLEGAEVRIFDIKTGRKESPSLAGLDRGEGHQFAAYYLMARDAGAASVAVGIIRPDEAMRDVFAAVDETALRTRFARFAELQRHLRFGRRGPLVSEYGRCEELPMATAPIDPKVLEQKASLYLLAK